jgi:hypothetical protein
MRPLALALFLLVVGSAPAAHERYLVTWAMESKTYPPSGDGHDFLAVYDIGDGANFGKLVGFSPTPTHSQMAHHVNCAMPANHLLFANDFMAAQSYVFDVSDPRKLVISAAFTSAGPYNHPHTFAYLSNGDVLGAYQLKGTGDTGGLVELDTTGRTIRSSSAAAPQIDPYIRPYSVLVVESLDRVVTTSAAMPPVVTEGPSHVVQVWRLSDLKLLKTIDLPKPPTFKGVAAQDSDEALLLDDGKTVLVKTSRCGLFQLTGLAGTDAKASYVYDFGGRLCSGVPVLAGKYWIQSTMSSHELTALDVRDPSHPFEVSHLYLGPNAIPHWIAIEPGTGNLVITGYGSLLNDISFASVDLHTGALTLDPRRIVLNRVWPDGWSGPAIPHGTVFY